MTSTSFTADLLRRSARGLAAATIARLERERPGWLLATAPPTFAPPAADLEVRVRQLGEAVLVAAPELYGQAIGWYRAAFASRGVADDYLAVTSRALAAVLQVELPPATHAALQPFCAVQEQVAAGPVPVPPSPIDRAGPHARTAQRFLLATLEGRADDAIDLFAAALADGLTVPAAHDEVLLPVQHEVGRMWQLAEVPIADEHATSLAVGRALELLQARIPRPPQDAPHVLAFAVGGNQHDLGLRMVVQRLQLAGLRVSSLGADLPAVDLPWALDGRRVDLLAVSATMLLHMSAVMDLVAVRAKQLAGRPPILVGGEPFVRVPDLHKRLGIEACARDAGEAAAVALAMLRR